MKSAYPRFTHTRIDTHPILGSIKIYTFDTSPISNESGCQTNFYTNNASVNNSNEFGIKMFNTSVEAFAAYQRQKIASDAGLAPPVGAMVRWIIRKNFRGKTVNRWGYETCIADCSDHARTCATILGSPIISRVYFEFMRQMGYRKFLGKESVTNFYADWESVYNNQLKDAIVFADLTDTDPFSPFSYLADKHSMKHRLASLSIVGTQYDDLAEVDMGSGWNDRLRLGQTWTSDDGASMNSDLHRGNIGLWNGEPVCIDFGYHICSPAYSESDVRTWIGGVAA